MSLGGLQLERMLVHRWRRARRSWWVPMASLLLVLPATAQARTLDAGEATQLGLLLLALLLMWLLWWVGRKRRIQEAGLLAEIRERESRLNLALWGSGDEFWDWNIRENTLYRLGANQLLGQGSQESLSTDDWRNQSLHPDDLPRVQ